MFDRNLFTKDKTVPAQAPTTSAPRLDISAFDLYNEFLDEIDILKILSVCPQCSLQGTALPLDVDTYRFGCSACGHIWNQKDGTFEDYYINKKP